VIQRDCNAVFNLVLPVGRSSGLMGAGGMPPFGRRCATYSKYGFSFQVPASSLPAISPPSLGAHVNV
jgi:hypothetical protein